MQLQLMGCTAVGGGCWQGRPAHPGEWPPTWVRPTPASWPKWAGAPSRQLRAVQQPLLRPPPRSLHTRGVQEAPTMLSTPAPGEAQESARCTIQHICEVTPRD